MKEPTDWVTCLVTVVKNDKVRLCIDRKDLNKAIRREHYPISTVEEVVTAFPHAAMFSVLDAKSGFWQLRLDYESSLLTTFNMPFGRYRWLTLPFEIKCASESFQRAMDSLLEGIDGAKAIMDDILIGGVDVKHHDAILKRVVDRATQSNLQISFLKCQIRQKSVKYAGHTITEHGTEPGTDKVRAIVDMPTPYCKEDVPLLRLSSVFG